MSKPRYRDHLPQLDGAGGLFLTDGGIETTLIFHDGLDLPCFAAFACSRTTAGGRRCAATSRATPRSRARRGVGFVLESPTWRANPDWGAEARLFDAATRGRRNRAAIALMRGSARATRDRRRSPMVISGCVGPRGDGYDPGAVMTRGARRRHTTPADRHLRRHRGGHGDGHHHDQHRRGDRHHAAAAGAGMPVAISFTVETDGRLPTGQASARPSPRWTRPPSAAPAYYMINCAHPTHFAHVLPAGAPGPSESRAPRQRIAAQPHRARRGDRPRRRRSGGTGGAVRRSAAAPSATHCSGRVLRHRPPTHRAHLRGMHAHGMSAGSSVTKDISREKTLG